MSQIHIAGALIDPFAWYNLVGLAGGLCWILVYVLAAYDGLKQRRCALPVFAICLNLGWEIIASFVVITPIPVWEWINRGWLALDAVIVYTALRYGRQRVSSPSVARHLPLLFAGCFALGLAGQMTYIESFGDTIAYGVAFVIDLFMAIFFVLDFLARPIHDGASFAIAWGRLLGDLGVSIQCYYLLPQIGQGGSFYRFLFVAIFALDAVYILLLWRARRAVPAFEHAVPIGVVAPQGMPA
jgi:hypothetical protein